MDQVDPTMESFIASYGLPFEEFRELMIKNNALMAGSAALALYLEQEGIDPGFIPNDLDIWMEDNHDTWFATGRVNQLANSTKFLLFLAKHGYNLTTKFDSTINESYYKTMPNIKHIFHFINYDGNQVQLICVREAQLVQYIQHHFDLTACMSWWNAEENVFRNLYPGLTYKKEMHILPGFQEEERTLKRVEKYKERGFKIYETPCPALHQKDPLEKMEKLDDAVAFDVFAYEDVLAGTFLRQSSYHVLLHMGDQFHAYHRKQLHKYLLEHMKENDEFGTLCELPHKQLIPQMLLDILPYSDFSIISLKQVIDNLYAPTYYTTAQWANKTPGSPYISPLQPTHRRVEPPRRIVHLSELAGLTESLQRSGLPVPMPNPVSVEFIQQSNEDAVREIMRLAISRLS